MAAKKKMAKKVRSKSIAERFEGTIVEQPIVIVNKTFLAGLGLATKFQSDFETKFDELAEDGEKVRNKAQDSAVSYRDQVIGRFKSAQEKVTKRVESAVNTVLDYSPVATTDDIKKLNAKLDRVLGQIAK